ncbi:MULTISPECIES: Bug family tripartite tricarboxylate transporter substrate binding protein [Agrobacterium]|jgi:tripartite-type tricarboxylate transporter receptor subunit TctC|uniref:Tripartite tricarboxylate transporter substrate binding protein n=2 Tax=Agrobacterium TaxID=357 RepID=A0AAF0GZG9_AGRTU|nr:MULTISPECIES: tripartite tricarboxylate transporter substrate binding protein [Agrobacterium]MDA5639380.1 tripartite tricarboxylate transporter substrate binding protein [Agrobacterium sp. ST15.13.013]MDA6999341.1 tripartite tricarboxylate transporter substrate binding protein [Agrobacterium salinitolerans]QXC49354.1 tripartite tricarboxylate transporter substrate binding protein [Agrobacterium salinitolerans]UYZ09558.1 tripartite tricarboxylate transporter substrate binding protein [Agrobac
MSFNLSNFVRAGSLAACMAATAAFAVSPAFAETSWKPTGPVNVVMHTKPGGTADIFIRTLAQSLEPLIGQTIVVVNAPGAGGATQMARVASAKPDGLTLGINTMTHFTSMLTNLKGTFSADDFAWIASTQEDPIIYFTRADSDIKSIGDLVAKAKERSGTINIGGFGPVGSMQHLGTSMLEHAAGVKFNWVGFDSTPDIMTALLGGHIDVGVSNLGPTAPFFESKRINGLGVLGEKRLEGAPDVPTFGEQGFKVDTSWVQVRGIFGPKDMPPELQQQIADAFHEAMKAKVYQDYAHSTGVVDSWMGPQQYTAFVRSVSDTATKQLQTAGLLQ